MLFPLSNTSQILTENRNVKYSTNVPLVSTSTTLHKTFMDTTGRTTLTLNAINIVDDFRDRELIVTYDYPLLAGFRKPLVIFVSFLTLFATAWGIGSLDVSIRGKRS
jgi:oligosaccharyltransferase complex subunit alpha (ribophorin I)